MQKKLLSFFLCLVTILTTVSTAFAVTPASAATPTVRVYFEDEEISSISVPQNEKKMLSAKCDYVDGAEFQWQILADIKADLWVDIQGQSKSDIEVSKALVRGVMDSSNSAYIRAATVFAGEKLYSEPVCVTIKDIEAPAEAEKKLSKSKLRAVAENIENAISPLADDDDDNVYVIINYLDAEKGTAVWEPSKIQLKKGDGFTFNQTIISPVWLGYTPYYCKTNIATENAEEAQDSAAEITISLKESPSENVIYNVYYKPALVPYAAKFFYQNIYDDMYTEDSSIYYTDTAYTGDIVGDKLTGHGEKPGFTALFHFPEAVAADGSTVFEFYYDRNYYLINFDLDGGYGTEPIYAKYDTPFFVNQPERAGYVFLGWDLCDEANPNGDGNPDEMPETVPYKDCKYKAIWEKTEVTYTIIYWAENADDPDYSFWGYRTVSAFSGETVLVNSNPTNAEMIKNDEIKYFTYNPEKSDKTVTVKGDGSTIANVYFTRNKYTLVFYDTRRDSSDYLCGFDEDYKHEHTDECYNRVCDLEEHSHSADGCKIVCGLEEHAHNANCESVNCTHLHGPECYGATSIPPVAVTSNGGYNAINNYTQKEDGYVYRVCTATGRNPTYANYFYLNGVLYYLGNKSTAGNNNNTTEYGISYQIRSNPNKLDAVTECRNKITLKCTHIHTEECYSCGHPTHAHSDSCYSCGKLEHTHTHEECDVLTCGKVEHVHDDSCKNGITSSNFSSTPPTVSTGDVNNAHVIRTITAKYQQKISKEWPDGSKILEQGTNNPIDYWVVGNATYNHEKNPNCHGFKQTTKVIKMSADLCDTSDNVSVVKAYYNTQNKRVWNVYYYFESLDQDSEENGNDRIKYNNIYYDADPDYTEIITASNSRFTHKDVVGMKPDVIPPSASGWNEPLYYDTNTDKQLVPENIGNSDLNITARFIYSRNNAELSFYNYNGTVSGYPITVKHGASIAAYKGYFEPPYPFEEKNAYKFAGWYTSPACVAGSEVDFDKQTVPIDGITLYAKWEPVEHTVNFFITEDKMNEYADTKDETLLYETRQVKHGNNTNSITTPESPFDGAVFAGWFYYENEVKKRFTPENYPVTRDIDIFAEWSSNVPMPYIVHYKEWDINDKRNPAELSPEEKNALHDVADYTYGWAYQGSSKRFEAKTGQPFNQLYNEYNVGWFPTYKSTSVTIQSVPDEDLKNPVQNEAWFFYVKDIPVPYIVRYLEANTNKVLHTETVYPDNENAVVTERFLPISGYVPDMYYKRLILQWDPDHEYKDVVLDSDGEKVSGGYNPDNPQENVITFYYTRSDAQRYVVHHMFQNLGGDAENYNIYEGGVLQPGGYSEYTKSEVTTTSLTDEITPLERVGYTVVRDYSRHFNTPKNDGVRKETNPPMKNGTFTVTMSPKETGDGAELYIYYTRIKYPYTVQYLEFGTDKILHDEKTGTETEYGATVTENYENLEYMGYSLVGAETQSIPITDNAKGNVIKFYYTKIQYTVFYRVWDEGGGTVDMSTETVDKENFNGSVPTPSAGYQFEGWYLDRECTKSVNDDWVDDDNRIVPDKKEIKPSPSLDNIYYAKFTPVAGELTIKRENSENEGNGEQVFVYKVYPEGSPDDAIFVTITGNGEKTIHGLTAEKNYIVEQQNDWSWRFEDGEKKAVIEAGKNVTVTFKDDAKKVYGLNGNSGVKKNVKGNKGGTD